MQTTLTDRYGLPLSTASDAARDAYVAGVDSVLSGVAGYRDHLATAIAADESFALAHIALARGLFMDAEVALARVSAARARELVAGATERERSQVNVLALPIEGKGPLALAATVEHLRSWPRDAIALAPATGVFGLYGFSGRQEREDQLYALLASLAPDYGEDWWFDTVYGFAACEAGRPDQAWTLLERAMVAHPRNANAAHYRTHVMYERGETDAALAFLEGWLPGLDKTSLMHCHLSWHLALARLGVGQVDSAWDAFRASVHPDGAWGPPINVLTDSASFLWRAELAGQPRRASDWGEVQQYAQRCYPNPGVAYADVHTLIAGIANDDLDGVGRLSDAIRERVAEDRYPPGPVVLWIAEGFAAYARGDWDRAIAELQRAVPQTVRIGGSRAQRDLVDWTLAAACFKASRPDEAHAVLARCAERRPAIVLS